MLPSVSIYLCILASNKNNKTYSSKLRDLKMMYDMYAHKFCFLCFFRIFHTLWTNAVGNIVRFWSMDTPATWGAQRIWRDRFVQSQETSWAWNPWWTYLRDKSWETAGWDAVILADFILFLFVFLFQTCFVDIKDFADFKFVLKNSSHTMGQLWIIVCGILEGFLRFYVDFSWLAFRVVHVVMLNAFDYLHGCHWSLVEGNKKFDSAHLPLFFFKHCNKGGLLGAMRHKIHRKESGLCFIIVY